MARSSVTVNAVELNRKANRCKVVGHNPATNVWRILSPSGSTYTVDLGRGGVCTCAWGRGGHGAGCSHEMAARKAWARQNEGRAVSFQRGDARTVARAQHKATAPVAAQGGNALTLVRRDRLDEGFLAWAEEMEEDRLDWEDTQRAALDAVSGRLG